MFQWLQQRPATKRRPARPAPIAYRPEPSELPPAFFADDDPAFLDVTDTTPAPQSAPPQARPAPMPTKLLDRREAKIAEALAALPPFPDAKDPERNRKLSQILAELDQIASEVCEVLEPTDWVDGPLSVRSIPR